MKRVPHTLLSLTLVALGAVPLFGHDGSAAPFEDAVDFARDIQPILEDNCWKCHGEKKQRGGLRLDTKAAALAGADFGAIPVILPGDSEGSRLMQVIATDDEDERMPPRGAPLDADEIATIERWIESGASWPDSEAGDGFFIEHWAYTAPVDAPLPEPEGAGWARNEVDRFVLQRLEEEGLRPSPEASRETLLRRLSLDITGLPPSLEERERFLADDSEHAYEALVDRLFDSPHYGERMARAWLDLARYADTNGYEKDSRRSIWRYRDWVIEAYNRDLGFDQFTIEQLAGDLLPDPTLEQRIATGFHRNTMVNAEGGVDPEEFRVAAVMDRVNTTGSVWLGTTLACAQCHTHKYDPFSHQDYYRLFAYFNSSADVGPGDGPRLKAPTEYTAREEAAAVAALAELNQTLTTWTPELESAFAQVIEEETRRESQWSQLVPVSYTGSEGTTLALLNEGTVLGIGATPAHSEYAITFTLPAGSDLRRLRLESLPHESLPNGASARSSHGNFVLSEVHVELLDANSNVSSRVDVARATADFHQTGPPAWPAEAVIDGNPATGWAIGGATGKAHNLVLDLASPVSSPESQTLRLRLEQNFGTQHLLGHLRFSSSSVESDRSAPVDGEVARVVRSSSERTSEQTAALRDWFRQTTPLLESERARKDELEHRPPVPTTLVMKELAEPRATHILERGSFLSPAKEVTPGVPAVLPQPPQGSQPNRLGLAEWLVSAENPLTARVTVNRLWDQVFGRGLVSTLDDFGTQGERPSHPALLDWLARTYQEDGWSTKRMLKRIVMSATYRQSSNASAELIERDPANRLLARGARYRVEAEMVRDIALTASGLLNEKVGGPSVFPPQPDGVWQITYSADAWTTALDGDRFRRGLYTFWRRTAPYPAFMAFDATSRELTCVRRAPSNTPLQALALLNDPAFVEAAVALSARLITAELSSDRERVSLGFKLCTGREPNREESDVLLQLLASERQHYAAHSEEAHKLTHSEAALETEGLPGPELAAWTVLCNVLLNLDETITRS